MNEIYGYCKAGCPYRVPSYDEFIAAASAFVQYSTTTDPYAEGKDVYILNHGKEYKIKSVMADNAWGFTVKLRAVCKNTYTSGAKTEVFELDISLPTFDKYADGIKFKLLDCYRLNELRIQFVYELNGERQTVNYQMTDGTDDSLVPTDVDVNLFVGEVENDTGKNIYCWAINDGFMYFNALPEVTEADNGKILRVVDGKWELVPFEIG